MPGDYETFEGIHLDLSRAAGKCRFASSGMGWKQNVSARAAPSAEKQGEVWTLPATEFVAAHWSRASKGYELKVFTRTMGIVQLDGFEQDDLDRVRDALKAYYNVTVEHKEHSLKGWNWGKADFSKYELHFNVANKPAFEIPYSEVSNLNLAGKAEVAVEFATSSGEKNGKKKKSRATAGVDQLVEMRFFVPGTVKKDAPEGRKVRKSGEEEGAEAEAEDEEEEAQKGEDMHAANVFYDTLKEKAEIGESAGVTYATFLDILFLTPRGRYDIDMYENSFRLRGKTYDYKIQYDHCHTYFLLPKPDDVHMMGVIGLDPPLRQGQTRYPFLVMQFKREEDMEFDLNISEDLLKAKYDGRLQMHYESSAHRVVSDIFRGLTGRKIVLPSKDFNSHHQQSGVKCSNKANEGHLFFLDKGFLFVPKPAVYLDFASVAHVVFSRVGGSVSASRTFDVTVKMKGGEGEYQFNNINREEQQPLEDFFKLKQLRYKNDLVEETNALLASLDDEDMDDDDADGDAVAARADRGSADEDEESVDEDFEAESESDVAEEYDSAHESSGSGSGSDDDGAGDSDDGGDSDAHMEVDDDDDDAGSGKKGKAAEQPRRRDVVAEGPARKKVKTKK